MCVAKDATHKIEKKKCAKCILTEVTNNIEMPKIHSKHQLIKKNPNIQ